MVSNDLVEYLLMAEQAQRSEPETQFDPRAAVERLRTYRKRDPEFQLAIAQFVEGEVTNADPVEGKPVNEQAATQSKVQEMPRCLSGVGKCLAGNKKVPDWDQDSPELRKSLTHILSEIVRDAGDRVLPTRELARQWQQTFLEGLDVPDPNYKGSYRGEEGLELVWVTVQDFEGVAPFQVSEALTQFEADLQRSIARLDTEFRVGQELDADQLGSVLDICAWAHAEWFVSIHFAMAMAAPHGCGPTGLPRGTACRHLSGCVQGLRTATLPQVPRR